MSSEGADNTNSSAEEQGPASAAGLAAGGLAQERAVRFDPDLNEGSGSNPTHQTNGNGSSQNDMSCNPNGEQGSRQGGAARQPLYVQAGLQCYLMSALWWMSLG